MRQANKQNIPASTPTRVLTQEVDESRPTFKVLAGNLLERHGNAHNISEHHHYSIPMFFHLQVSERFE
jgi:hypothetical protein